MSTVRDHTALVVPVPEVEGVVGALREQYDPYSRSGLPAHVTLMAPFISPDALTAKHHQQLRECFARVAPFDFILEHVGAFHFDRHGRDEMQVVYLYPDPCAPFCDLIRSLDQLYDMSPYAGFYDNPTPHLTVAVHESVEGWGATSAELSAVVTYFAQSTKLPAVCRAVEAWLIRANDSPGSFQRLDTFRFKNTSA